MPRLSRPACAFFLQLHQSQLELQEVRLSYRQLQGKVEELTEERSLQSSAATSTSLLSEIEQSMEAEELEQEREQVGAHVPAVWQKWAPGSLHPLQHCAAPCMSSDGLRLK